MGGILEIWLQVFLTGSRSLGCFLEKPEQKNCEEDCDRDTHQNEQGNAENKGEDKTG